MGRESWIESWILEADVELNENPRVRVRSEWSVVKFRERSTSKPRGLGRIVELDEEKQVKSRWAWAEN